MPLLRNAVGREINVPAAAVPYFPGYEPVRSDDEAVTVPARAGRGSSRDAWAAYAAREGVAVGDDDTREDIIAALDAAGVPTE